MTPDPLKNYLDAQEPDIARRAAELYRHVQAQMRVDNAEAVEAAVTTVAVQCTVEHAAGFYALGQEHAYCDCRRQTAHDVRRQFRRTEQRFIAWISIVSLLGLALAAGYTWYTGGMRQAPPLGACSVGQNFIDTETGRAYVCTPANTWTPMEAGGGNQK